jgi:hypothetical protein
MTISDTSKRQPSLAVFRALLRAPSVMGLLIANLLPIYGVVFLGWDLFNLIMIYWLETGIIGLFAIVNLALVAGWQALFLVPFFIVHFGGFMGGHLMFLILMFATNAYNGFSDIPAILWDTITTRGIALVVAGLLVSHTITFVGYVLLPWLRKLWRGEMKTSDAETGAIMGAPYGRVIIMHLTILFGAVLATTFGNKIALLILLIALKTISDLWSLLRRPVPQPIVS